MSGRASLYEKEGVVETDPLGGFHRIPLVHLTAVNVLYGT